eukprot:983201-Prymnesium_polylepis.1
MAGATVVELSRARQSVCASTLHVRMRAARPIIRRTVPGRLCLCPISSSTSARVVYVCARLASVSAEAGPTRTVPDAVSSRLAISQHGRTPDT